MMPKMPRRPAKTPGKPEASHCRCRRRAPPPRRTKDRGRRRFRLFFLFLLLPPPGSRALLKSLCDTPLLLVPPRQLHLPLLPLFLLLPPPQCGLEEVLRRAGVRQQRCGEERHRGNHVTDRDCSLQRGHLLKRLRPRPSCTGGLLSL